MKTLDIKDYLHLYLGCEAMHGKQKVVVCGLNINSYCIQNIINVDTFRIEDIKPILRPLSDMTDKESKHHANILKGDTESIRYLLSKGFDLFGLIQAGLAIDKTKV